MRIPSSADRQETWTIARHFGAPSAIAASRSDTGTRRSMSSVVRTMIGMASTASAAAPAQPEKPPNGATSRT